MTPRNVILAGLVGSALLLGLHSVRAGASEPGTKAGALVGVVQDRHGDAVPGARVVLLGELGEVLMETRTASASNGRLALGEFEIDQLPAGHYTVQAEENGAQSTPIRVPVSNWQDTRVRLRVDLGY
jgi:Carboxypeptidase regulatory-like domain